MRESKLARMRRVLALLTAAMVFAPYAAAAENDTVQTAALWVFIGISLVIAAVFVYVARSTRRPRQADTAKAYRLRRILFVGAVSAALIVIGFTLPESPYAHNAASPDHIVFATALRFAYVLSNDPIRSQEDLGGVPLITDLSVPAGATVEFRVASLDVNHSFAIYDMQGVLVGQTQAMPGYVNRLRLRFDEPGRYEVLCLEYCGIAHHAMNTSFTVRQP